MPNTCRESTEALLARAALWRVLARGFAYPEDGHARALAKDFARLRDSDGAREFSPRLHRHIARAARAWRAAGDGACAAEYMRLFLGSGPVSLHETAYGDGRRIAGRPAELADIAGFYSAFGFAVSAAAPDLPDHLCAEIEFASLLLLKQAYARTQPNPAHAALTRAAAREFLAQHLGRWAGALAAAIAANRAAAPYAELAALLTETVTVECRRARAAPELAAGRLPHDAMQEDSFVCPRAGAAAH
jgi:DMSO reductase family type II enzyme chaperone